MKKVKIVYDYSNLRNKMRKDRWSMRKLAEKAEMNYSTLSTKLSNKSEFGASEILRMQRVMGLEALEPYFFTPEVS